MDYKIPTRPTPLGVAAGGRSAAAGSSEAGSSSSNSRSVPNLSATLKVEQPEPVLVQEYSLRVPKTNIKPVSIMRFNGALGVDPAKWTSIKMIREGTKEKKEKDHWIEPEDVPKFGAGSEYGREAREEARKRKYGGRKKQTAPEDHPWLLKVSDKDPKGTSSTKKYKGMREGGVSENASYFIFTQGRDGTFEVFPVQQWYNFTPIQRYKALTSEEAEEAFGRRSKIMNYFSVMVRRRMKADDGDGDEDAEKPSGRGGRGKKGGGGDLKVSEMEDWADSDEDMDGDSDAEGEDGGKQKKKGKGPPKKGKKKKGSDEEAEEDSDDGDEEGRELDYISDTSGSEQESDVETKESDIKGVDQEGALKDLLESGSEDEEEGKTGKEEKDGEEEDTDKPPKEGEPAAESQEKKKKKKKKSSKDKKEEDYLDEGFMLEKEAEDGEDKGQDKEGEGAGEEPSAGPSSSGTKRKASDILALSGSHKKAKMEVSPALIQTAAAEGITEEAVRRYLLRKPMTVTELLHKFKSKKTKMSSPDMVNVIAHLLKKVNPSKRVQNQKMYLSLSAPK